MQKGAKKYFPALLFNFNWLSCFLLFLDFTEPSSLQPTPTTYLRTYVDLSCWRQFHFSIATREPVNGHKDCWKQETSLRLTNIHSFIVLMLFWARAAIHTYYFLTASFIKVSTLNYWDIYCLIHIFKPSSYLDIGKIHLADPCGSLDPWSSLSSSAINMIFFHVKLLMKMPRRRKTFQTQFESVTSWYEKNRGLAVF